MEFILSWISIALFIGFFVAIATRFQVLNKVIEVIGNKLFA